MAIENWIDVLCERFAIEAGRGRGTLKSYVYYKRAELPGKIEHYPCAITFPERVRPVHTASGSVDWWKGRTEFHLWQDAGYDKLPDVCLYAARIEAAMAGSVTLGGLVEHVEYDPQRPEILIPAQLRWTDEDPWHWGAVVYWEVKENVSGAITVAA